jgi:hypothetical protein
MLDSTRKIDNPTAGERYQGKSQREQYIMGVTVDVLHGVYGYCRKYLLQWQFAFCLQMQFTSCAASYTAKHWL